MDTQHWLIFLGISTTVSYTNLLAEMQCAFDSLFREYARLKGNKDSVHH